MLTKAKYLGQNLTSRRKTKSPSSQVPLGCDAWSSVSSNSKQPKSSVKLLNHKKKSPATQYPEMVAPDYDPSEPERSITPIVQELKKIKKRVKEVR